MEITQNTTADQIIDIRYKLTINTNAFILERNVLSFQVLLKISKNINHKEERITT